MDSRADRWFRISGPCENNSFFFRPQFLFLVIQSIFFRVCGIKIYSKLLWMRTALYVVFRCLNYQFNSPQSNIVRAYWILGTYVHVQMTNPIGFFFRSIKTQNELTPAGAARFLILVLSLSRHVRDVMSGKHREGEKYIYWKQRTSMKSLSSLSRATAGDK